VKAKNDEIHAYCEKFQIPSSKFQINYKSQIPIIKTKKTGH
jgi:hypothetical protein